MSTKLLQMDCDYCSDAPRIFGSTVDGGVPLVLNPRNRTCCCILFVPAGTWGIVTRHGEIIETIGEGYHAASLFSRIHHLVTQQHILFNAEVKECPMADNIKIRVDVSVIFNLTEDRLQDFVVKLNPGQLQMQFQSTLEQEIRGICRQKKHTEALEMRAENCQPLVDMLNKHFENVGVVTTEVIITDVQLPHETAKNYQDKSVYAAQIAEQQKRQEYDIQVQNHNNQIAMLKQQLQQERFQKQELFKKEYTEWDRVLKKTEAETQKLVAEINERMSLETQEIILQAEQIATQIRGEADQNYKKQIAEGKKRAAEIRAQADNYQKNKEASTQAQVASAMANALKIEADAEGQAGKPLQSKRDFEQNMRHLNVLKQLATNKDLVLAGNSGDNIAAQISFLRLMEKLGLDIGQRE